jgi:hypothetical protein
MGYPQGPPQQGPPQQGPQQGGWQQPPQQQQQPGYGDPYAQQGQGQGYAPFQGGQPMGGGSAGGYDWNTLYGQADHSVGQLIDAGLYTAIVKSSDWDRTKDGTKGAWTITFILTSGPRPGMKQVFTMAVSPKTNKGEDNPEGMGRMFRQLAAMGIPVPPPYGQQGWWQLGWNEQQVGQAMTGHPVLLQLIHDEYEGVTRNKVRDIQPPPPGAPTQMPQLAQQQPQGQQGFAPTQQAPQQWQPQQQQQGAPAPWQPPQQPQAQFEGQGFGQGYGQQQGPPQQGPPPGYQGQQQPGYQQQGPPANYQGPPQGYDPSVPPYAQQPNPGAPGAQQFTQQGQAWQPGVNPAQEQQAQQAMGQQQPWANPNGMQPGQQQQGPPAQQGGEQGPPQAPGWAGGQQQ